MNRRPGSSGTYLARLAVKAVSFLLLGALLTIENGRTALARSWSYHYHPRELSSPSPNPTPFVQSRFSTAQLLKQAILSDLAIYVIQPNFPGGPNGSQLPNVAGQLSLFDRMNAPDALPVLASLSGYYLGSGNERLYDCLVLRKGAALKPYLEELFRSGSLECLRQFGAAYGNPSSALNGHAFCPNQRQVAEHLAKLIGEIDAAKPCSDSDVAALTGPPLTNAP
jgi:hypothetical protein